MREILFRAKMKYNGQWVQGYYFQSWEDAYILWGMTNGAPNMTPVIPETVGQYTGLKDKNGKMVFEGDVLMALYGEKNIGKVYMDEACWFGACDYLDYAVTHGVEIIGNIHDNPELLERTEP